MGFFMARRQSVEIDLDTAHRLKAQGISTAEIARQLKLPVSTLKDHLKRTLPMKTTDDGDRNHQPCNPALLRTVARSPQEWRLP
jgi:hypothetical protein